MNSASKISVVESLETRELLAASPLGIQQVSFREGTQIVITGSKRNDNISVRPTAGGLIVSNWDWSTTVNGAFSSIRINAAGGDDKVLVDAAIDLPASLYGSVGNDTLVGGHGDDNLFGGAGNDLVAGSDGNDTFVSIGEGADRISGGLGLDSIWADSSDRLLDLSNEEKAAGAEHRVNAFATQTQYTRRGVRAVATAYTLNGENLVDPTADAGVTWRNYSSKPLFATGGPSADDVNQGQVGDCWYLATLASVARTNAGKIRQSVVELGDGTYGVQFGAGRNVSVIRVDGDLPVGRWGLQYAGLGRQESMWVAVMEKAMAQYRNQSAVAAYSTLSGGWMSEAFSSMGLTSRTSEVFDSADALLDKLSSDLSSGKAVTVAIDTPAGGAALIGSHAYTVVSVTTNGEGQRVVTLRNPWGIDGAGHDYANDGYVTVSASALMGSFWAMISAAV